MTSHFTLTQLSFIAAGAILVILLLHQFLWIILSLLARSGRHLSPGVSKLGDWARDHPLHARLAVRCPRFYAALCNRLSPRSFTGLPLTLMTLAAFYLMALLGGLIEDLLMHEGIVTLDRGINAFFGPVRVQPLLAIFVWITAVGAGSAVIPVAMTATGFLWADRRSRLILPLWVTLLGAEATTWAGKYLIGRARPQFLDVASAASPAFPSGHATGSMAVYGFLAYALARNLPRLRARFELAFWVSILILLIGFSRIFLSLHYMSDVLGGFLVGGFWLLVGFAIAERARSEPTVATSSSARSDLSEPKHHSSGTDHGDK